MKRLLFILCFFAAIIIMACSSTKIVNSWRDPDTKVSLEKLNKVLVVAFLRNETSRRTAEDEMVRLLKGKAVPSYSYFDDDIKSLNEDIVKAKLKNEGFDGSFTMRLVDVNKEVTYTPGMITTYPVYYRNFWGYYRRGWDYFSTPDRYQTTKTYSVETNVYSLRQNKLIWSGLTETVDPGGVDRLVADISKTIYKKMTREGFIEK